MTLSSVGVAESSIGSQVGDSSGSGSNAGSSTTGSSSANSSSVADSTKVQRKPAKQKDSSDDEDDENLGELMARRIGKVQLGEPSPSETGSSSTAASSSQRPSSTSNGKAANNNSSSKIFRKSKTELSANSSSGTGSAVTAGSSDSAISPAEDRPVTAQTHRSQSSSRRGFPHYRKHRHTGSRQSDKSSTAAAEKFVKSQNAVSADSSIATDTASTPSENVPDADGWKVVHNDRRHRKNRSGSNASSISIASQVLRNRSPVKETFESPPTSPSAFSNSEPKRQQHDRPVSSRSNKQLPRKIISAASPISSNTTESPTVSASTMSSAVTMTTASESTDSPSNDEVKSPGSSAIQEEMEKAQRLAVEQIVNKPASQALGQDKLKNKINTWQQQAQQQPTIQDDDEDEDAPLAGIIQNMPTNNQQQPTITPMRQHPQQAPMMQQMPQLMMPPTFPQYAPPMGQPQMYMNPQDPNFIQQQQYMAYMAAMTQMYPQQPPAAIPVPGQPGMFMMAPPQMALPMMQQNVLMMQGTYSPSSGSYNSDDVTPWDSVSNPPDIRQTRPQTMSGMPQQQIMPQQYQQQQMPPQNAMLRPQYQQQPMQQAPLQTGPIPLAHANLYQQQQRNREKTSNGGAAGSRRGPKPPAWVNEHKPKIGGEGTLMEQVKRGRERPKSQMNLINDIQYDPQRGQISMMPQQQQQLQPGVNGPQYYDPSGQMQQQQQQYYQGQQQYQR